MAKDQQKSLRTILKDKDTYWWNFGVDIGVNLSDGAAPAI